MKRTALNKVGKKYIMLGKTMWANKAHKEKIRQLRNLSEKDIVDDASKAKADMKNYKMGTKPHNNGNVYRMCECVKRCAVNYASTSYVIARTSSLNSLLIKSLHLS